MLTDLSVILRMFGGLIAMLLIGLLVLIWLARLVER